VLRQRLQEMTDVQDVSQHPMLLECISRDYPNSIRIVESEHPIDRYTCVMHVFDFTEKPEYLAIADYGFGRVFAGADFARWLIANGHLVEVPSANAQTGDLVAFFKEGKFKHVGLLQPNGRVVSKWGIGHLYDHGLLEVPESYGSEIRFFKGLSYDEAYDRFAQFAEQKGIPFETADS